MGGGIVIGQNAVVGACALVNKDVPKDSTAVGVPCRIIAYREDTNRNEIDYMED